MARIPYANAGFEHCAITHVDGLPELIGECGLFVPPKNPEAMAEIVAKLLETNPALLADLGQKARKRIKENFSLARMQNKYAELYAKMTRCADGG